MKSTYKDILKAITLFGGVHGLNLALNIIRTKLAAMLLGPAGVGLNSIYNETRELMHTSTNVGMDKSGVTEIAAAYGIDYFHLESNEKMEETIDAFLADENAAMMVCDVYAYDLVKE